MPTTKQRINVTADAQMESALKSAARRDRMSISSKTSELLHMALDIEEDFALASIAKERDVRGVKYIPHDAFWRKILKK